MVFFYRLMRQGADTHRYPKALPFAVSCLSSASIILMIKNAGTEGWPANFALQLACVLELDTTAALPMECARLIRDAFGLGYSIRSSWPTLASPLGPNVRFQRISSREVGKGRLSARRVSKLYENPIPAGYANIAFICAVADLLYRDNQEGSRMPSRWSRGMIFSPP
jgi:hypothetical protein